MRKAEIYVNDIFAGMLTENNDGTYSFKYNSGYTGQPVSLTMPIEKKEYSFDKFPPFFDGVLPEGRQLEGLLKIKKIDRHDYFTQLTAVGSDMVGAVTVKEAFKEPFKEPLNE